MEDETPTTTQMSETENGDQDGIFRSMAIDENTKTPYSDATKVKTFNPHS